MITKNINIEDLVNQFPLSVNFLREKGLVCILCGEPVWGTLDELAKQKGFSDENISALINELNNLIGIH